MEDKTCLVSGFVLSDDYMAFGKQKITLLSSLIMSMNDLFAHSTHY